MDKMYELFRKNDQMKKMQFRVGQLTKMGLDFELTHCTDTDGNEVIKLTWDKDRYLVKLREKKQKAKPD